MANKYTSKFPLFKTPVELLTMFDPAFLDETYKLYPWQVELLNAFSRDVPIGECNRLTAIAANGSGKSQFILAPCCAWMAVAFENSLSYVTSSSASQLDTQTERFLDSLAQKMNKVSNETVGADWWNIVKRKKTFLPNNSYIDLFATDEPRRAEGKHPLVPDGEFAIFVDEGKSIVEEIYGAIDRCTGATRRLDISSAGGCSGHFYEINTRPELGWQRWKITYEDCPHVKPSEVTQLFRKHGINDPLVRSILFSEFTDINDATVIRRETLNTCEANFDGSRIRTFGQRRAGIDVAYGGGDEMVISIWEGNINIGQESVRFYNAEKGIEQVIHWIQKYQLANNNVWIEFDGINKGLVYGLESVGYSFNKFLSGGKPMDNKRYANRMTEQWFKIKRYVEEGWIKFTPDMQLRSQLTNRYYKRQVGGDKIILERKEEARKKGHPSPDRADAVMIAWADCPTIEEFLETNVAKDTSIKPKYGSIITADSLSTFEDHIQQTGFFNNPDGSSKSKSRQLVHGSEQVLDSRNNTFLNIDWLV